MNGMGGTDMMQTTDPEAQEAIRKQLLKSQRMSVALEKIISIAGRDHVIGRLAAAALEGKPV